MTKKKSWKKIVSGMLALLLILSTMGGGMSLYAAEDEVEEERLLPSEPELVDVNVYLNFYDQSKGDPDAVISMTGTTVKGVIAEDMILASVNPVPGYFEFDQNDWPRVYINYSGLNNERDITEDCEYDSQTGIIMIPAAYKGEVLTVKSVIGDESYAYVNMIADELKFPAVDSKASYSKYVLQKDDELASIQETTDAIEEIFCDVTTYDVTGEYSPQNGYEAYIIPDGWADNGSAKWSVPMNKTFKVAYDPSQYYEGQVIYLDGAFINIMGTSSSDMWEKTGLSEYKGYDGGFGFAVCMWKEGTPFHLLGTPGASSEKRTYTWEWSGDSSNRKYYTWGYDQLNWLFGTCVMRIANAGNGNIVGHDARVYVTNKAADGTLTCYLWVGTSTDSSTSTSSMQNVGLYFRIKPDEPQCAFVNIKKVSGNETLVKNNSCYSLKGATYGIYRDEGCTDKYVTLITDEQGNTNTQRVAFGKYYVKEISASKGYALDKKIYPLDVTEADKTYTVTSIEEPVFDPAQIELYKVDQETSDMTTQGAASLEGAQFTITYYGGHYTKEQIAAGQPANDNVCVKKWVMETKKQKDGYKVVLGKEDQVSGDTFFYEKDKPVFPLGTLTIQETKAPDGYLINNDMIVTQITQTDGTALVKAGHTYKYEDRVKRGDFEFVKVDENGDTLAHIPFVITSVTTGESHTIQTDENGYFSTSSDYVLHSEQTNRGDAESGVWFGLDKDNNRTPVHNDWGALPFDTYTVTEQECEGNQGKVLREFSVVINRDKVKIDRGTIVDEAELVPEIQTTAVSADTRDHIAMAGDTMTIIDTIAYSGLTKGEEYTITGKLVDQATGEPILDDQKKEVTATKTFVAKESTGTVDVTFRFAGKSTEGKMLVAFEYLALGEVEVAKHEELQDADQTVLITKLRTQVADKKTNTNQATPEEEVSIVDRVTYENLISGKTYTVKGVLMNKATKAPLLVAGNKITAEREFVPTKASGSVDLTFTFSGSALSGKTVVVFEDLYTNSVKVGSHSDINDEAQTIYFRKVTEKTTEKINTVSGNISSPGKQTTGMVKTGDSNAVGWLGVLAFLAIASICVLIYHKRLAFTEKE